MSAPTFLRFNNARKTKIAHDDGGDAEPDGGIVFRQHVFSALAVADCDEAFEKKRKARPRRDGQRETHDAQAKDPGGDANSLNGNGGRKTDATSTDITS